MRSIHPHKCQDCVRGPVMHARGGACRAQTVHNSFLDWFDRSTPSKHPVFGMARADLLPIRACCPLHAFLLCMPAHFTPAAPHPRPIPYWMS